MGVGAGRGVGEWYRGRLACAGAGSVYGSGNARVSARRGEGAKVSDVERSDDAQDHRWTRFYSDLCVILLGREGVLGVVPRSTVA